MVPRAAIENLLDEYLLVGIRELYTYKNKQILGYLAKSFLDDTIYLRNKLICVRIQCLNHGIKALDANYRVLN